MIGKRLAHYEITAHVGSGGMGDVYRATDTRLDRSVALKLLPQAFAHDPGRAARFSREAKTLASLNHPHIAAIHGLETADGQSFLVMEFVAGQTLADLIARASLPVDDAVAIARQIAAALEAAHDKGVVHRDLKPANVMITADGQAKVLDFGLAKWLDDDDGAAGAAELSSAATLTADVTHPGVVLGTPAYMAPEQAKGRPVDRRSDIFAFGCLLYEMLTGRPPFRGESVADTLAAVLERDPDWTRVPATVPPAVQRLLRLCLEKDPRRRRQTAADVRIDLEYALSEPVPNASADHRRGSYGSWLGWIASGVLLVALIAVAAAHFREARPQEMRLEIATPATRQPSHFALSPDGRHVVFSAAGSSTDAADRLHVRALNATTSQVLAGTDGARYPFWSPDSQSIGFFASGQLRRVGLAGGPPQTLAPTPAAQGGTWAPDNTILFAPNTVSPLMRVPASGGEVVPVTRLDSPHRGHRFPSMLHGGRQFLFFVQGAPDAAGLFLGSLDGTPPKRLAAADSGGAHLAPDRIVFVRQGVLVAQGFEPARGELTGEPVTIASGVGAFSTAATGILAYRLAGGAAGRMSWYDRTGKSLSEPESLSVNALELSPDDRRLAFDRTIQGNRDVWLLDLIRGGLTRFTTDAGVDGFPVWSPDGSQIVFESTRKGSFDLWMRPFDGATAETLLLETPDSEWPLDWSHDGRFLLYQRSDLKRTWDLWALPMTGSDRTPVVVANTPFAERMGEISPDGRFVAYDTDESGRPEVIAQAFPAARGTWRVSTGGGVAPRWSADGKELFFIAPDGKMMAVSITVAGSTLEAGKPVALFSTRITSQAFKFQYAVARDGRFVIHGQAADDVSTTPITLLLNWRP